MSVAYLLSTHVDFFALHGPADFTLFCTFERGLLGQLSIIISSLPLMKEVSLFITGANHRSFLDHMPLVLLKSFVREVMRWEEAHDGIFLIPGMSILLFQKLNPVQMILN